MMRTLLIILGVAAAVSCSAPDGRITEVAPGISLSVSRPSSTLQGTTCGVTATILRVGAFTGAVTLTVSGLPSGVESSVSNSVTTQAGVTTTLISIFVGAATPPGVYPLVMHGTGEGVKDVAAHFNLTVITPPPPSGYSLELTQTSVSVPQGMYRFIPVNLNRSNFTGTVTLSLDSPPAGVSQSFFAPNPVFASATTLYLVVSSTMGLGTFTIPVRGVAPGLADRTAPLTITVTEPPYAVALSSSSVTVMRNSTTQVATVSVARNNYTGPVDFYVDVGDEEGTLPFGVTASFAPNPTTGNSSVLTLAVGAAAVPGVYDLYVWVGSAEFYTVNSFQLTIQ